MEKKILAGLFVVFSILCSLYLINSIKNHVGSCANADLCAALGMKVVE